MRKIMRNLVLVFVGCFGLFPTVLMSGEKEKKPPAPMKDLEPQEQKGESPEFREAPKPIPPMKEWEDDVRQKIAKDERLKKLAAKYHLALLHSRSRYCNGEYKKSAFSFLFETSDDKAHGNFAQLIFTDSWKGAEFHVDGPSCVLVDLGKIDFEKDPDPKKISVTHPGFSPMKIEPKERHVYIERIRDQLGNNFYALFEVVTVDPRTRYVAFLWRKLPGGKVVFPKLDDDAISFDKQTLPSLCIATYQNDRTARKKEWEQAVRKRVALDPKLSALVAKFPLVLLASPDFDEGKHCGFTFIHETSDLQNLADQPQVLFTGGEGQNFDIASRAGNPRDFVVDLGEQDFRKDPDPKEISIDHPGLSGDGGSAKQGRVFLQHVTSRKGSDFYVIFQVVALSPDDEYLAFIWRRLPGGKIVK